MSEETKDKAVEKADKKDEATDKPAAAKAPKAAKAPEEVEVPQEKPLPRYLGKVVKADSSDITDKDHPPVAVLESDDAEEMLKWFSRHPSGASFAVLDRKRPAKGSTWHTSAKFNEAEFRGFMAEEK